MTRQELNELLKPHGFPQMVLTRNLYSWIGSAIAHETSGIYNHFLWVISPNTVASQDMTFKTVPLDDYLEGEHIVKFVTDTRWDHATKVKILVRIWEDLKKPWYRRMYDPLAIFGQWTGLKWIQNPLNDICSDKVKYLKGIDPDYDLEYPSPTTINEYQKAHQKTPKREGYLVTARFLPEDL